MSRDEKFIRMATIPPFEEVKDTRNETSIPELVQVAEMRDAGNVQEAIDYARSLMKMYPDNDLIPFMIAYIYYQRHFPDEALQVAVDAIPRCPRKYRLYSVAGLAELDRGRLPEAIVWWSRSVVAQCTVADFQEYDPFLYLAHTAEIVEAKQEAAALFTMADAIEPGQIRLDGETLAGLAGIKRSWARAPLLQVLRQIEQEYLHS